MDSIELSALGWRPWFEKQLTDQERRLVSSEDAVICRIGAHHASQLLCLTNADELTIPTALVESCGPVTVGDWLLLEKDSHRALRRMPRRTLIERKAPGEKARQQLIAANIDTLFIVSSCNRDFNLSRLERYLVVADQAGVTPVVVLTKADQTEDPQGLRLQTQQIRAGLVVETLDARSADQSETLYPWCAEGQTVALVGSSGVGKSTLAMSLGAGTLETAAIREADSKGRHTTTARSMHRLSPGGLLIDNPGMREFQLTECTEGVSEVFEEIAELSQACRFRDCTHQHEPGCAVRAAVSSNEIDERRLNNYLKLQSEQERNARTLREQRDLSRKQGKFYKSVISHKRQRRDLGRDV